MGLLIDMHLHTRRHSKCSAIDPSQLVRQAVIRGLNGLVITEHHYQWPEEELRELLEQAEEPGFLLFSGFEYTSSQGDILIYGLRPADVPRFIPGVLPPEKALDMALNLGGVCVAAHPTRAGMSFDERIFRLPLSGIEVRSVNLKDHEQRLAMNIVSQTGIPPTASSDAHRLTDVGKYANEFDDIIFNMSDLQKAVANGRFRPAAFQ